MSQLDCEQVLRMVWQFLDGEIDEAHYQAIQAHVADCAGCGPRYAFQRRLLTLIEEKCRDEPLPAGMRERLARLLNG